MARKSAAALQQERTSGRGNTQLIRNGGGRERWVVLPGVDHSRKSEGISTCNQEPHRHNQANEQGEDPQRIQGSEAGRVLCVYWSDKGGNEPAFVWIGSKCSFLHG